LTDALTDTERKAWETVKRQSLGMFRLAAKMLKESDDPDAHGVQVESRATYDPKSTELNGQQQ
jgi:hypothetical protein